MNGAAWRATAFAFAFALPVWAQEATPLSQRIQEAQANNSNISAADHGARAARMVAPQKAALPDPTFTYQQFSVGSPKPFAGYTNSDFAYVGIGASQELPYPGKLRLTSGGCGTRCRHKGGRSRCHRRRRGGGGEARLPPACLPTADTFRCYIENQTVLDQMIEDATARYKVGQGMQQDILQAQIERTNLLRELTMHHQEMGRFRHT